MIADQPFDMQSWMACQLCDVTQELQGALAVQRWAQFEQQPPDQLLSAMRYATLGMGKRLRPLLVMAAFDAVQSGAPTTNQRTLALRAACAVELIHAYSLVHDDLPCMDNDVLRRGQPTLHVEFGQASALLAGDALQALAFELLVPDGLDELAVQQAQLCRLLARAAGCAGMAGGQAIDLASVGQHLSEVQLQQMHSLKTGALLQASVLMGAVCGQASSAALASLQVFGAAVGLAFQVVDDVLDASADLATLGKTPGKDFNNAKPTYASLMGLDAARALAQKLKTQALQALQDGDLADARALQGLAAMVVERTH